VESTAGAAPDEVDIDSVTLATRCQQQSSSQRPSPTLVSHRHMAVVPPRRYGAQRHIATRLLHHCLSDYRNSCMSSTHSQLLLARLHIVWGASIVLLSGVCQHRLSSSVTLHCLPAGGFTCAGQAMTSCCLQSNYSFTVTLHGGPVVLRLVRATRCFRYFTYTLLACYCNMATGIKTTTVCQRGGGTDARPLLRSLHWLSVKHRVTYKMASLTFKTMSSSTPAYLSDLIQTAVPVRPLWSSDAALLTVPRT